MKNFNKICIRKKMISILHIVHNIFIAIHIYCILILLYV